MSNTAPQGSITDLQRSRHIVSSAVSGQMGIVMLNPDGSSIAGGSASFTNTASQGNIVDLEKASYISSSAVPGQIGVVGLNPDASNL